MILPNQIPIRFDTPVFRYTEFLRMLLYVSRPYDHFVCKYVSRPLAIPTEDKDLDRKIQLTLYYIKS